MDVIELARELGKAIQQDERFLAMQIARQNSDNDDELQQLIGEFNLKRMAINNEAAKENRDEAKLQQLNSELRETYAKVMQNKNMNAYNEAKELMDNMRNVALEEQAVEAVLAKAKVSEKATSFNELMNQQA